MTTPWTQSRFALAPVGRVADIRLGKMLQPARISDSDEETSYLRAGHLAQLQRLEELPVMFASDQERTKYGVESGDLIVAEGGDVGRTAFVPDVPPGTIIQNSLHRVRSDTADLRHLRYCLEGASSSGWLDVVSNRSTFGHLTREKLAALRIPLPSRRLQSTIADFLDVETARVDALVEGKRHMIDLVEERKSVLLRRALEVRGLRWGASLKSPAADNGLPTGWKVAHLSTVLEQLTNGYVGPTRNLLVDAGVKYIQSLHIKDGAIEFSRRPYYVPFDWHAERPRIHLRPGDVLLVQTGDIGQVAVVPPDFGQASCHALQIARVRRDLVVADYLAAYLRSPFGRHSLLSRVTGALHPHLEGGIRDIPIVLPALSVQTAVVDEIQDRSRLIDRLRSDLARQIELLREHRQSLITSAVTGQLDVSKAAA